MIKEGVDLSQPPKIIIDTIHQVKGGEADNVVLSSKCNFPSHYEKKFIRKDKRASGLVYGCYQI